MNFALTLVLQASMCASAGDTYADAYKNSTESGKPLVVLVGADWCPGCRSMNDSMTQLRGQGKLDRVNYAHVNTDREHDIAGKLMTGGSIPQLVVYRKTASGWTRTQMTGAHSASEVTAFISAGEEKAKVEVTSSKPAKEAAGGS